ncbi:MAG TPA: phage tail protein [Bryobacteraceae bacterium]|nr:phage tail protein [Bryobacteraceae bacterium]
MLVPYSLKEQPLTDAPLVVFNCVLADGQTENWCTHAITINGTNYAARVLQHSNFEIQTASDQGVDGSPKITVILANADSYFSEIEQSTGFKGAQLTVGFLFYDLVNNVPLTDVVVVFQGICNPPDQIKEATFRLSAGNRMNLQRLTMPPVRIQRRCPWDFPTTLAQRTEAVNGGENGQYSPFYRCGYSADVPGGTGNLNNGVAYTSCGYTKSDCQARGMWTRFGGIEYVPPVISVRGYGKDWQPSALSANQARYNDFVPMVYGTAWYYPPIVFARNDGNLTRMEVLLGIGQMQGVLTVLVNGYEIPLGVSGKNMTGTGWYNVVTLGTRDGGFDLNFVDSNGNPLGDPYGSMAYLSVVVPNVISSGTSLPTVEVLAQGLQIPIYDSNGNYLSNQFSNNPAWILLDLLRQCGWAVSEIDIPSFAAAAAYCDEQINSTDLNGNPIQIPRFQCNLVLQNKRSGGDVVRGIRNAARLYLTYGPGGVLQLQVENAISLQQPAKPVNSNSSEPLNGGWPSYEFGDGSTGVSGILRLPNGEPSVTLTSRAIADTPNSYSIEFQDALNNYQQDSYNLFDPNDIDLTGQEVSGTLMALGIPNYDQAARMLKFNLDKSVKGNRYIQFQTSVRAFGIRPGDIITVTYLKEGLERQAFRVLKISPSTNYRTATILAQIHDDAWYADSNGQTNSTSGNTYPGALGVGVPKPLLGSEIDANGNVQFGIVETSVQNSDGTLEEDVIVSFLVPTVPTSQGPAAPLVSLASTVGTGGTLQGGETLYYGITGVDSSGNEGVLSFLVTAVIPANNSSVTLSGLSFAPGTSSFNVYRGNTPAELYQIASQQTLAAQFTDNGLPAKLVPPSDPNFDHANFYWRIEQQPEVAATVFSPTTIGNGTLAMGVNAYQGMVARITRGTGAGQERTISGNSATVLTVSPSWDLTPDATSFFAVAEAGWHFGAQTKSSPVQFAIPNQAGEVVEITGRSANSSDVECPPQLCTVTRWQIGGAGTTDTAVPPAPLFGANAGQGGGTIEFSGISFSDLTNTQTISSATFTIHYWDELQPAPSTVLANAMAATDTALTLNVAGTAQTNSLIQVDAEVMLVTGVTNNGLQLQVTRGANGSTAAAHNAGATVYVLASKTVITPFPEEFFGSPYSGNWSYPLPMPDIRVASAEAFVTNARGDSPSTAICLTGTTDNGLRTLSGGQYSFQVQGFLAVHQNAAPALVVDTSHAVRDVFAILGTAADLPIQLQINAGSTPYCQLTIQPGQQVSNSIPGTTLPPLAAGTQLTLSVLAVGQNYPGSDLTVLIRL